ncbi:MAG: diguanylate cyclase [Pseudomonadota bacterium]
MLRWIRPVLLFLLLVTARPALAVETAPVAEPIDDAVMRCFSLRRSEPAAAIALAESILAVRPLSVENEIKTLSCLGMATGIAGNAVQAGAIAARIEHLLDANPMPAAFALRALSNAGAIYHTAGQISRAEALYARAYAVAEAEDAAAVQVATLVNIALIHADYLDAPQLADSYYRKALDLAATNAADDLQLLYNHAVNLVRLGRYDDARGLLDRAEAAARKSDNQLFAHRIAAERAGLLARSGQRVAAATLLDAAIEAQAGLPDPSGQALSLALRSALERENGDRKAALRSAEAALALVEDGQFRRAWLEATDALAAAHAALGQAQQALAVAERRHALQLSTLQAYDRAALAGLQARLQDAANARELERLRHDGDIQALRMARDRLLRNWLIAATIVLIAAGFTVAVLQRRVNRRLHELSATDMLTGLINRRAATERLAVRLAERHATARVRDVLLLVDIDRFKAINDRFGHDVGDRVLTEVSARLKAVCRPEDIVARWGGEEFLVACAAMTREQACEIAERLRLAAAAKPIELAEHHKLPLTVSVGFAPYPFFDERADAAPIDWQGTIKLADRALYAVKHAGRDAWAGLWGGTASAGCVIDAIVKDPERAARKGDVTVFSSRPVVWRARIDGVTEPVPQLLSTLAC